MLRARDVRDASRDEQGFTLVELLVVMLIMGFVAVVVLTSFVTSGRATVQATNRIDAINDLTPAMERLTRDLRVASPLVIDNAGDYETSVGTEFVRDGQRYRHEYYVELNGTVREVYVDRYEIAADGTETTIGTSNLVTMVDNDASTPVFTYIDRDDNEITCTSTTEACRDEHLTAVRIGVTLVRAVADQPSIRYETVIGIRNTRYQS